MARIQEATWPELQRMVKEAEEECPYRVVLRTAEESPPLTPGIVEGIANEGWKVETSTTLTGRDYGSKTISLEKELRGYMRDKTLFRELVSVSYIMDWEDLDDPGKQFYENHVFSKLRDHGNTMAYDSVSKKVANLYFSTELFRGVNNRARIVLEYIARNLRADPKLLKQVFESFGLEPEAYDRPSYNALYGRNDLESQGVLRFAEPPLEELKKTMMD